MSPRSRRCRSLTIIACALARGTLSRLASALFSTPPSAPAAAGFSVCGAAIAACAPLDAKSFDVNMEEGSERDARKPDQQSEIKSGSPAQGVAASLPAEPKITDDAVALVNTLAL